MSLWTEWSLEPGAAIPMLVAAALYVRGARFSRGVTRFEVSCFWTGFGFLVLALNSPLDKLGELLFSAHMAQHEILMLAAAPLLVLSRPLIPALWALPFGWRRAIGQQSKSAPVQWLWRAITRPLGAWSIHAAAIWVWHVPFLFDATLKSEWIHAAQHMSFFGSALLFWWSVFQRPSHGTGVLSIFTTAVHTSILGALLTFSGAVWYSVYIHTTPAWGISALQDQQIGGLIMWVPGGLVYLAAGLWCFATWLRESEMAAMRNEYAS